MDSGTFRTYEDVDVFQNGKKIAHFRIQKPNHKFGDTSRPDIAAGLGSPSVLVETYSTILMIEQDLTIKCIFCNFKTFE